jgi:hypothetical protein
MFDERYVWIELLIRPPLQGGAGTGAPPRAEALGLLSPVRDAGRSRGDRETMPGAETWCYRGSPACCRAMCILEPNE